MAATEPVHFFDITSSLSGPSKSWSPNTLKTRLVLNYKRIPYTQSFISYPDIAPVLKQLSVPPLEGVLPYTLPAIIHKPSVKSTPSGAMNDSFPIALHLEEAFPAPTYASIFPSGDASYSLAVAVDKIFSDVFKKAFPLVVAKVPGILDERGAKYFYETREKWFGKPLSELGPQSAEEVQAMWKEAEKELEVLVKMLKGPDGKNKEGPFFEGEKASYADFLLLGFLAFFERVNGEIFEKLMSTGDGAFKALWDASKQWVDGQGEEKEWAVPQN
ncbi:hypothetical protein VTN00DRAFT_6978 [Thermoascus crustaceus]|uniref:uncharacterized protein n=1 Tax=Thermoascus crustaceus TaxID=5088 RepID=UPI0037424EAE